MAAALDAGVNLVDTAEEYSARSRNGVGQSEQFIGAALRKHNVRVNAICPGFIYPTGMTLAGEEQAPDVVAWASSKAALERAGHPDEIAAVASFLASDDSSYVTGTYLVVDGGWTAGG